MRILLDTNILISDLWGAGTPPATLIDGWRSFSFVLVTSQERADVIVIGPAVERGTVVRGRVLSVLKLLDGGEQDDKDPWNMNSLGFAGPNVAEKILTDTIAGSGTMPISAQTKVRRQTEWLAKARRTAGSQCLAPG